jgi:hypothetical protein
MTAVAPLPPLRDPLGDRVSEQVAQQAVQQAQALLGLLRPSPLPTARSLASVRDEPPPRVVLNLGLGRDSVVMS